LGEFADEKKDDDFSLDSTSLAGPVKGLNDQDEKEKYVHAQPNEEVEPPQASNSLFDLAHSIGRDGINPAPDAPSASMRSKSRNSLEIMLTISGEDDEGSVYSRIFEVDCSNPKEYQKVIAHEMACALSEDGTESKGETRHLRANVSLFKQTTPNELSIAKSVSWGTKSVQTTDYENFEDARSLSTISTSVHREPRNDLTVEISKRDSKIVTACVACASMSTVLCGTLLCGGGYSDPQVTAEETK